MDGKRGGRETFMNPSPSQKRMLDDLQRYNFRDERILQVMRNVPRHDFVPTSEIERAYFDDPLPIGYGQTISQPYMVAMMTQSLALTGSERVLEIGTGSGYQTAILAELSKEVFTIERIEGLLIAAKERLTRLGYRNVQFRVGDGTLGWPEAAPFDAMLVAAATPELAAPWVEQLAVGGRLVAPVGSRFSQMLTLYVKHPQGLEERPICGCVFVPLLGQFGWQD